MPTNHDETLLERYTREAEIDARMMAKAEIVKVPRELAVRLLDEGRRPDTWAAQDDLRAILAQPVADEQAEPVATQDEQYPPCDFCGVIPDHHPWHGSGMFKGFDSPHIHACNDCRHLLPSRPAHTEQQATVKDCLTVQPLAYAVFAANGNAVCFSTRRDHPSLVALKKEGHSVVSLAPIAQTATAHPDASALVEALESMTCAYRMAIQAGHARITALGGDCDSVERMLADFPEYGKAIAMCKAYRAALAGKGGAQ